MRIPYDVITINLQTGEVTTRRIDHDVKKSRIWLGKHCFWAARNGHAVLSGPAPFTLEGIAVALTRPMDAIKNAIDYAPADDVDLIEE